MKMHELEITACQIARLVLGYLKAEKCDLAHEEFLKSSKHLKEHKGRIITRVDHKTLVDFLTEYSQINILIQERIEETDFYNEQQSRTTLLDQLTYLLDCRGNFRASTPNRSPIHKKFSSSDVGVNTDFYEKENVENLEVRATSLEELPGNLRSSSRKRKEKQAKNLNETKDEKVEEGSSIDLEVLTQTLLEHRELHEKLADTINVVRNAPEHIDQTDSNTCIDKNNTAAQDVEAAIKTIVQKATSDPFFDKLVKEVIGEDLESYNGDIVPQSENIENQNSDGNFDAYLKFRSNTVETPNSVMVNSSNVLMVQTASSVGTIDISKPCYVINNATQPIYSTGNVLSEQDIMSMPIVVCDDNKQDKQGLGQFIIPANVAQPVASTYLVNIKPKNDQQKNTRPLRERRKRITPKPVPKTESIRVPPKPLEPTIIPIIIQPQESISTRNLQEEEQKPIIPISDTVTPANEMQATGSTPRSGSHVRALDFSTPQKEIKSWDSDLRGLVKSSPERESINKKSTTNMVKGRKKKDLNKTAEEGKLIEQALCEKTKKKSTKKLKTEKEVMQEVKTDVVEETPDGPNEKMQIDSASKLVLSSSILNVSKRSLVDVPNTPDICGRKTPVDVKSAVNTVKRNIVNALETPMKLDVCPKTPGFFSPINNTDTPLTKVLKEQLHGIDISTIPTPKFPVTPNFPLTPSIDAHYTNRPTDYSSSSSYYHPSDNENNRSIEQLIEECNRLENDTKEIPAEKQVHVLNEIRIPPSGDLKAVAEKMKSLSKNVIGRKNLKLVEPAEIDSSCSTCSSDSSSEGTGESRDSEKWGSSNQTVIAKQTPQRYSLRLRKNNTPTIDNKTETITAIINNVKVKSTLENVKTHDEILLEMEEKRKKTIEKLENDQQKLQQKRKKVVEKKVKPVRKPLIKKAKSTKPKENIKTDEILEPFEMVEAELLRNTNSSTPNIVKPTKFPPVNKETEKLVDNLKAILNSSKTTTSGESEPEHRKSDEDLIVVEETKPKNNAGKSKTPTKKRLSTSKQLRTPKKTANTDKQMIVVAEGKMAVNQETEELLENMSKPKTETLNETIDLSTKNKNEGSTKENTDDLVQTKIHHSLREMDYLENKCEKNDLRNEDDTNIIKTEATILEEKLFGSKEKNSTSTKRIKQNQSENESDRNKHKEVKLTKLVSNTFIETDTHQPRHEINVHLDKKYDKSQDLDIVVARSTKTKKLKQEQPVTEIDKEENLSTETQLSHHEINVYLDKKFEESKIVVSKSLRAEVIMEEKPFYADKEAGAKVKKSKQQLDTPRKVKEMKAEKTTSEILTETEINQQSVSVGEVFKKSKESSKKVYLASGNDVEKNQVIWKDNQNSEPNINTKFKKSKQEKLESVCEKLMTENIELSHKVSREDRIIKLDSGDLAKKEIDQKLDVKKDLHLSKKSVKFLHESSDISNENLDPKYMRQEETKDCKPTKQNLDDGYSRTETDTEECLAVGSSTQGASTCTYKAEIELNKPLAVEEECEKLMSALAEKTKTRTAKDSITEELISKTQIQKDTDKQEMENIVNDKPLPTSIVYDKLVDNVMDTETHTLSNEKKDISNTKTNINDAIKEAEVLVASDENAEKLVSDLKERGIHLIHNKSSSNQQQMEPQEPEVTSENTNQNNSSVEQTELDLFESEFSVCLFHRENVRYKHDPYIRPNKKMSDYDFSLLKKEMTATVYLADCDAEVQKVMTCTPFDSLLEIPSKIDVMPKKKWIPRKDITKIQKCSPLDMLNKELSQKNKISNSPLEGLYDDEMGSHSKSDEGVIIRKKTIKKSEKSEHKRARSLSSSHEKKLEEPTRKSSRIQNRRSSEPRPSGSKEVSVVQEELNTTDNLGTINESISDICKDDAEDELMNYAAVGTPEKCSKKRKADEKLDGHHVEKKIKPEKCKQLLQEIDVDDFLSRLHGDT